MVGIPLTYWKLERVGSKLRIYVSEHEIDEEYKAYAHSRDGVVQDDYLYIGAYKGSVQDGKLRSLHDVMSTGTETIGEFREYAKNNGTGYGQMNWATMTLMQIFTVLLTKSLDSQTALGYGYVFNDYPIKSGGTTKLGLFYDGSTITRQIKFLGIEDFWGNRYDYVDGLVQKDDKFWTNIHNINYNDDAIGYVEAGNVPNFKEGYFKEVTGTTESGFLPAESGGSFNTYYCDFFYTGDEHGVAIFGGAYDSSSESGAFQLDMSTPPTLGGSIWRDDQGARLLFLKQK